MPANLQRRWAARMSFARTGMGGRSATSPVLRQEPGVTEAASRVDTRTVPSPNSPDRDEDRPRARPRGGLRDALERDFKRLMRLAAKPYAHGGWHLASSGLIYRGQQGHWSHVVFRQPYMTGGTLEVSLWAGTLSPYLMRVVNRIDPNRPPSTHYLGAQAPLAYDYRIGFSAEDLPAPPPFEPDVPLIRRVRPVLSPSTAVTWLGELFALLVPRLTALSSDEAMRQWLIRRADEGLGNAFGLRMAILLTRHLSHEEEIPALLERAEREREAEIRRLEDRGLTFRNHDRSINFPQFWSHRRFLRFLDETPA
jgi:hypothetical protein